MKYKELKQGKFRWRKKFRYLPNRKQIIDAIGVEWLGNRLFGIICKHLSLGGEMQILRVRHFEFVYIIHITDLYTTLEIIQKEPKYE